MGTQAAETYDGQGTLIATRTVSTTVEQDNALTLAQRAQNALTNNATFQAIASPTNAQTLAQVQALTRQCNGIIRLLLGQLDSANGT